MNELAGETSLFPMFSSVNEIIIDFPQQKLLELTMGTKCGNQSSDESIVSSDNRYHKAICKFVENLQFQLL